MQLYLQCNSCTSNRCPDFRHGMHLHPFMTLSSVCPLLDLLPMRNKASKIQERWAEVISLVTSLRWTSFSVLTFASSLRKLVQNLYTKESVVCDTPLSLECQKKDQPPSTSVFSFANNGNFRNPKFSQQYLRLHWLLMGKMKALYLQPAWKHGHWRGQTVSSRGQRIPSLLRVSQAYPAGRVTGPGDQVG